MNWLPIVERELRVAARKRSTFWLRVGAAVTALVIGGGFWSVNAMRGAAAATMGSILFYVLTWLCLAAGLSAGLFLTSDCLSEEKREGTLGLLFLTDLRGYDVVLGKLLATSLRGLYGLLAVLPIVAITQLMGGIAGAQYWKSSLALVNGLFLSLAVGMLVSTLSRDSQRALGATLLLLLLLALGGPAADAIIVWVKRRGFAPVWSLSSPAYVLVAASAWGRSPYWTALLLTQVVGWLMLAMACALVPHTWQEGKRESANASRTWAYAWKYGGLKRRGRLRLKLIERDPVAWLACRERWQSQGLWAVAVLVTGGFVCALIVTKREAWMVWNYVGGLFTLFLYLWAASQACRLFVEARRSGMFELMLVSPVNEKQVVGGQWRALLRMFGVPVVLLLSLHVAAAALSQLSFCRIAAQTNALAASAVTNQSATVTNQTTIFVTTATTVSASRATNAAPTQTGVQTGSTEAGMVAAAGLAAALSTGGNLLAICWFGMWMGMTSRTANLATLKTLLFVQIIPWFVIAFGVNIFLGLAMAGFAASRGSTPPATWLVWWPLMSSLLGAGAAVGKDVGFIIWSRNKLRSSLREEAARIIGETRLVTRPPLPGPVPAK